MADVSGILLGGAVGITGGLVAQVAQERWRRSGRRDERRLDNIIRLYEAVADLNRAVRRIGQYRDEMLASDVPLTSELTEALHDARNRSLLAMERLEDADIRKRVASFRHAAAQSAAANTRVEQQMFEEQCEREYEPLIETLGGVIREHS